MGCGRVCTVSVMSSPRKGSGTASKRALAEREGDESRLKTRRGSPITCQMREGGVPNEGGWRAK
eukprot:3740816-Prymnesium_polylepis.1